MTTAQQWQWAVHPVTGYEVVDVSVGTKKQSVVITTGADRSYVVTLIDSSGISQAAQVYYFGQWYGDRVLFSAIDADGCVWILSRQMLDDKAILREYQDEEGVGYREQESGDDAETDFHQYIVLEKFDPELRPISTQKLMRCSGGEYAMDVYDMEMDQQGNIWFCGEVTDTVQFQERVYVPGVNGGAFLVRVPFNKKSGLPWLSLFVKNSDCCQGSIQSFHLAVNGSGTCVISGSFTKEVEFENGTRFTKGPEGTVFGEMFLAAFSSAGKILWTKRIGAQSDDKDVIALSDGSFVCSGTFNEATKIDRFTVPGGKNYGNFVMRVDAKNGAFKQFYCQDTSSILHLFAGSNGGFYGMFCRGNSSQEFFIYHFDTKLKPELSTEIYGIDPFIGARNGTLVIGGMWNVICSVGKHPHALFLGGNWSDSGSLVARWDFETR
jgi:hypothetical protein